MPWTFAPSLTAQGLLIGLGKHALIVAVLAALVAVLCRWIRHSSVVHALWVLVLLKLLTPPIVQLEILPSLDAVAASTQPHGTVESRDRPASVDFGGPIAADPNTLAGPAPGMSTPEASEPPWVDIEPGRSTWDPAVGLLLILALGSVVFSIQALDRLRGFRTLTKASREAPEALRERVRVLARTLGLWSPPEIRLVPARLSPMVWPGLARAVLLLPEALLPKLDHDQLDTILVHELAHLRRRDHWVRLLELAATILFWWHPALWLARRRLSQVEERACDAWVVHTLPHAARAYAGALLETLEHLTETARPVPALATGMGRHDMRERLTMILTDKIPQRLTPPHRLVLSLGALCLLLIVPVQADSPAEPDQEQQRLEAKALDLAQQQLELENQMRALQAQRQSLELERRELEHQADLDHLDRELDELEQEGLTEEAERLKRRRRMAESEFELVKRQADLERQRHELAPLEHQMQADMLRARRFELDGDHQAARAIEEELQAREQDFRRNHDRLEQAYGELEQERLASRTEALEAEVQALTEAGEQEQAAHLKRKLDAHRMERELMTLHRRHEATERKTRQELEELKVRAEALSREGKHQNARELMDRAKAMRAEAHETLQQLELQAEEIERKHHELEKTHHVAELKAHLEHLHNMRNDVPAQEREHVEEELRRLKAELERASGD